MEKRGPGGGQRSEALAPTIAIAVATCFAAVIVAQARGAGAAAVIFTGGAAMGAVGYVIVQRRRRLGGLRRQFAGVVAGCGGAAVVAACIAVAGDAELPMSTLTLVALLFWAVVGVTAVAYALVRSVAMDVERVTRGLMAVGEGRPRVVLDVPGDDEAGRLAAAGNRMIEQLMKRETERDEAQRTRQALVRATVTQLLERTAERDAAEARRRELAAAVSHDVRTPLTSLRLLADALQDELVEPDDVTAHAGRMLGHIAVLHSLTEQVFELARLEAGDTPLDMVEADLGGLLRETADQLEMQAAQQGVSIVVEIDAGLRTVLVAPDTVIRVVVNLVQNAIEHTPSGGSVRLAARPREEAFVEAEVSDTGHGIAARHRERIFEPFFRGDRARSGAGTGLGLSIARGIVESHGGQIWLAEAANGACIRFTLPVADATSGQPRSVHSRSPDRDADGPTVDRSCDLPPRGVR